jgi:hypothetical protein
VIIVDDEPGILSQTQRRRRYPDHQQRARSNNLQPSHGAKKYSLDCLISSQMFPAPTAAKLLLGDSLSAQNHFPSSFAIRTTNSTITRMPTVVQIHIGIIMITPRA